MQCYIAYHAVTEQPMHVGQILRFDAEHPNGVGRRVMEKLPIVRKIYAHPERYRADALEHHTAVALRELAMEEIRRQAFPQYPSRMNCLYVSGTLHEAQSWFEFFKRLGRPTYQIVKLSVRGRCFAGNANLCFQGTPDQEKNLRLARLYWENHPVSGEEMPVCEMLADGEIEVLEILRDETAQVLTSH